MHTYVLYISTIPLPPQVACQETFETTPTTANVMCSAPSTNLTPTIAIVVAAIAFIVTVVTTNASVATTTFAHSVIFASTGAVAPSMNDFAAQPLSLLLFVPITLSPLPLPLFFVPLLTLNPLQPLL